MPTTSTDVHAFSSTLAVARAVSGGFRSLVRGRTLLAVVAIAFGIALGYAVELMNGAAVNELAAGLATLSGDADIDVRGPRLGFDEALYPLLAKLDGVAVASPVIETTVTVQGHDTPLTIIGVDVFRAAVITPALVGIKATSSMRCEATRCFQARRRQPGSALPKATP